MTIDPSQVFAAARFGLVTSVEPVTVGMSGAAVYAVTTTKGAYVLKVAPPQSVHWDTQVRLQTLAAVHGIGPKIELVDKAARAVVSERISGVPFGRAVADPTTRRAALASLAEQLARLHAIAQPDVPAKDAAAMARALWASQSKKPGFPAWALPLESCLAETDTALAGDARRVLSHGDPNPANMLWDGTRVWLVDWDNAGLAHPYFDAAIAANFLAMAPEDGLSLLAAQEGAGPDAAQGALFRLLRKFAYTVYGTAFLSIIGDLAAAAIPELSAAPELTDVYARIGRGELVLRTAQAQAQFATALLRQALRV